MSNVFLESKAPAFHALLEAARAASSSLGVDAYVVGGTVRDALLGLPPTELDLVVDPDGHGGDAAAFAGALRERIGGTVVPLDAERGVVRLVASAALAPASAGVTSEGGVQADVATLAGGSILADLARRDFTANALAVPLAAFGGPGWQDAILDPLGGRRDIAARRLRLASASALADDPSRLLRAVRLHATRALAPDDALRAAIERDASLLAGVAPERLQHELLLILAAPDCGRWVAELDELGLLTRLFPELEAGRDCTQPPEHYWNVLEHSIQSVGYLGRILDHLSSAGSSPQPSPNEWERGPSPSLRAALRGRRGDSPDGSRGRGEVLACVPWAPAVAAYLDEPLAHGHARATYVKLGCLLHDVAKPATRSVEPNGRIRFLGHPELGASMAEEALRRLRFSAKAASFVAALVRHHLRPAQMAPKGQMPSRRAIWRYYRDLGEVAVGTLYLNLADYLAARGPQLEFQRWERHARIVAVILAGGEPEEPRVRIPRLVTGHDLITALALEPGPTIGWLLNHLEEAAAAGDVATKEEALTLASRLLAEGGPSRGGASSPADE